MDTEQPTPDEPTPVHPPVEDPQPVEVPGTEETTDDDDDEEPAPEPGSGS